LAFSYRDFAVESTCLRGIYERRRGRAPRSFLELAAGPAGHAFEMLSAGLDVMALDLAPDMAAYARSKADERGLVLPYAIADMIEFAPPGAFDLVACLLCSASYLLTDDAVLSHFASVRACLAGGGMYVLELTHPSELVGPRQTKSTWTMRDEAGELHVAWGGDPGAAIDGIWTAEVNLLYRPFDGSAPISVEDKAFQRGFTYSEVVDLAQRSGFSVEATLGGYDENVALDSPKATRMIVVLTQNPAPSAPSK
jgi:SAM-dependent methyltransferase